MRGPGQPAQRPRKPMHRSQTRIGQRQPAAQADPSHLFARLQVLGLHQPDDRRQPARDRVAAQRIGQRVGAGADVWLDHLRDGIQPRCQRHPARTAVGQRGVHDRQRGQHPRVAQADLAPRFGHADDGVAGDLGPGAGGGGNGHEGQGRMVQRQALPHDLQVIQHRPRRGDQRGDGLARVDHRAAAHRDDDMNRRARLHTRLDQRHVGLMRHRKGRDRTARGGQVARQGRAAGGVAAVDQQHPPPQGRHPCGGLRRLPPSEQDLGSGGKGKGLGHGGSCR